MRARTILALCLVFAAACPGNSAGKGSQSAASDSSRAADSAAPSGGAAATDEQGAPGEIAGSVTLMPPGREPVKVRVELARTPEERRLGLMFRKHMDADAGMFFIFERPSQLSFWMRNTYLPLDLIFIEPDLRVLGIVENAEPMTDTSRSVPGLSQYVLEVNAGFSREHGIEAGTQLQVEGFELP